LTRSRVLVPVNTPIVVKWISNSISQGVVPLDTVFLNFVSPHGQFPRGLPVALLSAHVSLRHPQPHNPVVPFYTPFVPFAAAVSAPIGVPAAPSSVIAVFVNFDHLHRLSTY
jgi:hypothetical protein